VRFSLFAGCSKAGEGKAQASGKADAQSSCARGCPPRGNAAVVRFSLFAGCSKASEGKAQASGKADA
jgi:hypothetical protein